MELSLCPSRCPHGAVPVSQQGPLGAVPVPQQPVIILQQLPAPLAPTAGPARGDLLELMMIQNSQMHQVVMHSLALAALTTFGLAPAPPAAQEMSVPLQGEEEEEAVVFHHHYITYPGPAPVLPWPVPARGQRAAVRHLGTEAAAEDGQIHAVPPPPPPSATGTVGPSISPASEYYDMVMVEEGL
ncbi:proline-rich protein 29 [Pogoniulus pusillus]|uniref:proline-rich protein 29 n=1 Tax=Pogoniulus pusillus TaxID=488313 RepID=UPI0030B97414